MSQAKQLQRLFVLLIGLLFLQPIVVTAHDGNMPFSSLKMTPSKQRYSEETACVAPEADIRRHHMLYILHQRDETVYEGVRTRQFSLEECINCHALKDEQGEYLRVEDDRHFCATCHTYASVKIDCFECHSDVPVRSSKLRDKKPQLLTTEDQAQ